VERIKKDGQCLEVLGNPKKIRAFGEASWNRWNRNRPIASTLSKDRMGVEHLHMHFNVAGPLNEGTARVHMARKPGEKHFEYRLLAVDVKGAHFPPLSP
jgi:mitochondrial import inner membrane translocase subunit TIM21